jgi:hypothetical protein
LGSGPGCESGDKGSDGGKCDEDCRDRKPARAACGKIGIPAGLGFSFERCIEDGGAVGGFPGARFSVIFGFPLRLGATISSLLFQAFFASGSAPFNDRG